MYSNVKNSLKIPQFNWTYISDSVYENTAHNDVNNGHQE